MKKHSKNARGHAGDTRKLKRSGLFLALAAVLGGGNLALAQDAADEGDSDVGREEELAELERITVTGFRQAVERAVATKRDSTSIVESVYAEEIGKLPDVSIAEALARLPGLTAQRTDGRAQTIAVRGLGPDFSTALLNGREQVTTGDNRGVEFDQYPAELLGSVVVYKTPDSTLIGQGLAGTVDMRTIRPLEAGERVISASARYEFTGDSSLNPEGKDDGYRASLVYIDQFNDRTLGVTLGAAIQSTPQQIERFNSWGYADIGDGILAPGGAKPFVQSNELERLGLMGTIEYAPTDRFHSTIDLSYSDFTETQFLRGIEFPLFWGGVPLQDGYVVEDGVVVEGVFDGVKGVMRSDFNKRDAELFTFGWNSRFDFGNHGLWGAESDLSYSRAKREDVLMESYAGTGPGALGEGATDALGFAIPPNGVYQFFPSLDYTDRGSFVLTDPQGWGGGARPDPLTQAGFINNPETTDWLARARFSIDRAFVSGAFSQAIAGIDLGRRDKERTISQTFLTLPGGAAEMPIPEQALLNRDVSLSFIGIPGQLAWNPRYLLDNVYVPVPVQLSSFDVPQDWRVREDTVTGFVRLDIDHMLGTVPVTGNIGVQWVYTDQTSKGFRVAGEEFGAGTAEGGFIEVEDGDQFHRFLPSLNLIFALPRDYVARFGASRVMARPRMDQLNSSLTLNTNFPLLTSTDPNQSFFSAGGGNPQLRPMMANTVDVSLEKYFADNRGYVALSGFYKDLEDFVNPSDSFLFDFSAFIDDFLTPEQAEQLGTPLGIVSGPTNRGDGWIRGFEFATALPAGALVPALEGFGALFSASYTDSKVKLGDDADAVTVPGLSKWVINTTLYFERAGFQARVSHRYRDEFLSEIFGISATRITREAAAESVIDAQIGYEFQHGPLQGLNVVLQANNLTDEPFTTFQDGDSRLVIDRQKFGRNFLIGVNYKF